jgi:hypothetical protein
MNCQESRERIADLIQGDLPDGEAGALREHLHSCPACWQEWQELHETWTRLGILPDEQPSQNLRRDFYRHLEASRRELAATERRPRLLSRLRTLAEALRPAAPAMRLAAAVLVVAIGFGAGFFMGSGGKNGSGKIERLSREKDSLQQQMTLSLLNQPSASARLQGIALTSRVQEPEPSLIAALLDTLDSDPSVNVRLSAVDALYLFSGREQVRSALSASLARQTSPLVQIALIDLLVSLKEKQAATALKKLLNDRKIMPEVQQRAQLGIGKII